MNAGDIEFMRESQDDIYGYRKRPITVIYPVKEYDDFTGELIGESEETRNIEAVVTEISIRSRDGERYVSNGIEYEAGDAKFDVKEIEVADISDKITRIKYDGNTYEILGGDRKGIGVRNRIEIIGRVIT